MVLSLKRWRGAILRLTEKYQIALSQKAKEKREVKRLKQEVTDLEQVQKLVQETAAEIQNRVYNQIATVVTKSLETVFGEDAYEFRIEFDKKRGKTEAVLSFYRNGLSVDPMDAAGGGVVDVATFALRLSSILSATPRLRRLVVLDEPFKHLHADLQPLAGQLLLELAKTTKTQFVIVTHSEHLEVGKVINLC